MNKVVRLLALLIVLLAASAVPSSAIIPNCWEFCDCESNCDWAAGTGPPPRARTVAPGVSALASVPSPPSGPLAPP